MHIDTSIETDPAGTATVSVKIFPAYLPGGFPIDHNWLALDTAAAALTIERGIPAGHLDDYWTRNHASSWIPAGRNIIEYTVRYELKTPDLGPAL